jgi:hypothetical protein
MVEFDQYDNLSKQEEMKRPLKHLGGWYDDINYFKSKRHRRFMDFNWYLEGGRKPHSHNWGRKPYWREKRREQRQFKRKEREAWECIQVYDLEVM